MNYTLKTLFKLLLLVPYSVQSAAVSSTFFTPGFGTNGYVTRDTGGYPIQKILQDSSGRIITFGRDASLGPIATRYSANGTLETEFASVSDYYFKDACFDSSGNIIALAEKNDNSKFKVIKYNTNGQIIDSVLVTEDDFASFYTKGLAVDNQDSIVVVGSAIPTGLGTYQYRFIYRFNSDLALDTNFYGGGSIFKSDFNYSSFNSVVIDGDMIWAAGSVSDLSESAILEKYSISAEDNQPLLSASPQNHKVYNKIILDSNGKLVLIGETTASLSGDFSQINNGGLPRGFIARFNEGQLDTTFNSVGYKIFHTDLNTQDVYYTYSLINHLDKYIFIGEKSPDKNVISINQDGSIDTSLNQSGYLLVNTFYQINSLVIDSYKRIIVAGSNNPGNQLMGRFFSTGSIDSAQSWNSVSARQVFHILNLKTGII